MISRVRSISFAPKKGGQSRRGVQAIHSRRGQTYRDEFAGEGPSMFPILGGAGVTFNGPEVLMCGRSVAASCSSFGRPSGAAAFAGSVLSVNRGVMLVRMISGNRRATGRQCWCGERVDLRYTDVFVRMKLAGGCRRDGFCSQVAVRRLRLNRCIRLLSLALNCDGQELEFRPVSCEGLADALWE